MIKYFIILLLPLYSFSQPVVNAGTDKNVPAFGTVNGNNSSTDTITANQTYLDGSKSTGGGFAITSITWSKISGPSGAIDTIYKPNSLNAVAARFNKVGTYQYKLTITNSNAQTASDTVVMTATKSPPLIQPAGGLKVKAISCGEYHTNYLASDGQIYQRVFNGSAKMLGMYGFLGGVKTMAGGQYWSNLVDSNGWFCIIPHNVYVNELVWIPRDSTGALFDSITYSASYISTDFALRNGNLYVYGQDRLGWYGPLGTPITKPLAVPMPPGGRFYTKICIGEGGVEGLANDGTVWVHGVGNKNPVQRTLPRAAIDIWENRKGTFVAIIPDALQPTTSGWPFVWGLVRYAGNPAGGTSTTPTDYRTTWKMTVPIKSIASSDESISVIDTTNHLFSIGWNGQGEVGTGYELVNKSDLYQPWYASDWLTGPYVDSCSPITPSGHTIKYVSGGNAFGFYKYAIDERDSCWSWGRNKSFDGGNGKAMADGGSARPNGLDILSPTQVSPLYAAVDQRTFVLGSANAGSNQSITGSSVSLSGISTATTFYTKSSVVWTRLNGPNTPTITSPASDATTVTGLITGTYNFIYKMIDNNTGQVADTMQVIVNNTTPPVVTITPSTQTIYFPTVAHLAGSASTSGGATIVSWTWSRRSGPTTFSFTTPNSQNTNVTFTDEGTYVFNLDVLDSNGNTGTQQATVIVLPGQYIRLNTFRAFRKG
jgi:hypothetical protein